MIGLDVNDPKSGPFVFVQDTQTSWQACLGDCSGDLGLIGGIREFIALNKFVSQTEAAKAKNMQLTYSPDIKAYFRF